MVRGNGKATGAMTKDELTRLVRRLERRVRRLEATLAEEREQTTRRVNAVRTAANRRLTAMMRELAGLRHHEARAQALERLLAERTAGGGAEGDAHERHASHSAG
jgi:uncharacterized protein YlxW (UPF0749 family)